ncbi:hypothetical protein G9A89_004103 [Geosiphon pyriformis]|nr:hypothetical protein G9A89_004103 [Geosiphon pyriformis]
MLKKKLGKPLEDTTTINLIESLSTKTFRYHIFCTSFTKVAFEHQVMGLLFNSTTEIITSPKSVFHGSAGGFFLQKKKVVLGNIKYSGNKKDVSLKSGFGSSMYSNVESLSDDNVDIGMFGVSNGSILGSVANTLKVKYINTSADFGFLLVAVNKFFALNINFSAVEEKLAMAKTQLIRKNFSKICGFGEATTLSKFEKII